MTQVVRISSEAFRELQLRAVGFESVGQTLERVLKIDDDTKRKEGPETIYDLIIRAQIGKNKAEREAAMTEIKRRFLAYGWIVRKKKKART